MIKRIGKVWVVDDYEVSTCGAEGIKEHDAVFCYKTKKSKTPTSIWVIHEEDGTDLTLEDADDECCYTSYNDAIDFALECLDEEYEDVVDRNAEYQRLRKEIINKRNGLERAISKASKA